MDVSRREFAAPGLHFGRKLGADCLFDLHPITIERGGKFVARRQRPVVAAPGGPLGVFADFGRGVLQALEERLPLCVDRGRVTLITGVDFVHVGGVRALQKGRKGKSSVRVLARHGGVLVIFTSRMEDGAAAGPKSRTGRVVILTLFRTNYRGEKNEKMNYAFNFSTRVFPSRAGDGE